MVSQNRPFSSNLKGSLSDSVNGAQGQAENCQGSKKKTKNRPKNKCQYDFCLTHCSAVGAVCSKEDQYWSGGVDGVAKVAFVDN